MHPGSRICNEEADLLRKPGKAAPPVQHPSVKSDSEEATKSSRVKVPPPKEEPQSSWPDDEVPLPPEAERAVMGPSGQPGPPQRNYFVWSAKSCVTCVTMSKCFYCKVLHVYCCHASFSFSAPRYLCVALCLLCVLQVSCRPGHSN